MLSDFLSVSLALESVARVAGGVVTAFYSDQELPEVVGLVGVVGVVEVVGLVGVMGLVGVVDMKDHAPPGSCQEQVSPVSVYIFQ